EQVRWSCYGCDLLDQDIWLCYHAAQPWSQVWLHGRQAYWSQGYAGGRANRRAVMQVQQAHWERTVASGQGPAYRIHTQRLALRCWHPTDAPPPKAAIDANLEHLRPWMPWAQYESTDLHRKIEYLRRCRGEFDLGQ